jgi:RNA polymerase sigma-70 factor (ECF subfamily)
MPQGGPLPDLELVQKVKIGDSEAFAELVARYQDRVFNTCWRICGNLEDARDLTQEAFLKVFDSLGSFRQESGFYTWLYRIAVNLALSLRRKSHRRRERPLEDVLEQEGTQAESLNRRLGRSASATEPDADQKALVARGLNLLEDDFRAVIVLRDLEGLDYHEIAGILEIPAGTVRSRLHRARTALREFLQAPNRT